MTLARVVGTVVPNTVVDGVAEPRYLLVEPCDDGGDAYGDALIGLDLVGARRGDVVLFCKGSSCRWTDRTDDTAVDLVLVGIVNEIDIGGTVTYRDL